MITVTTLLLALGLAVGVYLLRKRFAFNRRNSEQDVDARQLEQRLSQVAKQSTEQVTLAVLQLEEKLEQANATIEELRYRTQLAEGMLWQKRQDAVQPIPGNPDDDSVGLPIAEPAPAMANTEEEAEPIVFSKKLAVAAYQLSQQSGAYPETQVGEALSQTAIIRGNEPAIVDETFSTEALPDDKAFRYAQVAALMATGMNEVDIAKQLDLGIGEVRLAGQLLQNKKGK